MVRLIVPHIGRHECRHADSHQQYAYGSSVGAASQKTAERGIRVLSMLLDNPITKRNCVAIYAATSGKQGKADADLVKVRISSIKNGGYER